MRRGKEGRKRGSEMKDWFKRWIEDIPFYPEYIASWWDGASLGEKLSLLSVIVSAIAVIVVWLENFGVL